MYASLLSPRTVSKRACTLHFYSRKSHRQVLALSNSFAKYCIDECTYSSLLLPETASTRAPSTILFQNPAKTIFRPLHFFGPLYQRAPIISISSSKHQINCHCDYGSLLFWLIFWTRYQRLPHQLGRKLSPALSQNNASAGTVSQGTLSTDTYLFYSTSSQDL